MNGLKNVQQIVEYCKRGQERADKQLLALPADVKKWTKEEHFECAKLAKTYDIYKELLDFIGV